MSWHRFAWASLLVLLYKQRCLPRPVICTIKSTSLNQIWQIVQGEGVEEENQQSTSVFPILRLLCSLDLENPRLTEVLVFFLRVFWILIQRKRGKMTLISTRSPCARLFIIRLYNSVRAGLSHPDYLLSTFCYIRLDWSSYYSDRYSQQPLCILPAPFLL